MNNMRLIIYCIFTIILLALTGYAVFVLNATGWWFLLTIIVIGSLPEDNDRYGL